MGCRNACICSGRCSESCYEAERYCGEAEDIYDELHGKSKEEEEYYKAMESNITKIWKNKKKDCANNRYRTMILNMQSSF